MHTGDKPDKCDICVERFSLNCNFKRHIRTHTGDKPDKCDIRVEGFSLNCNFKTH